MTTINSIYDAYWSWRRNRYYASLHREGELNFGRLRRDRYYAKRRRAGDRKEIRGDKHPTL